MGCAVERETAARAGECPTADDLVDGPAVAAAVERASRGQGRACGDREQPPVVQNVPDNKKLISTNPGGDNPRGMLPPIVAPHKS